MRFAYEGFTHKDDIRSFNFSGMDESRTAVVFSIEIDLPLFARHKVAMQEGPNFCLQMLTSACAAGPSFLEKFHHYRIVEEDLRPLMLDREKRAILKALKPSPRRFIRKPGTTSQLRSLSTPENQ